MSKALGENSAPAVIASLGDGTRCWGVLYGPVPTCCGVDGLESPWRWMLAVAGGGILVRRGVSLSCRCCRFPGLFFGASFSAPSSVFFFFPFGLASPPPYFSRSSWVESYRVASFSFWIVFARSACWSFSLETKLSMRTSNIVDEIVRTRYIL